MIKDFGTVLRSAPITAKIGMTVIIIYLLAALFAPILAPFGESQVTGPPFQPPSAENLLGTDQIGRDVLSRLFYGARNTIGLALLTTTLAFLIGGGLGILAAVYGGIVDTILARVVDVLMAFPALIFKLLLLTVFGTSVVTLVTIIAIVDSTRVFRLSRAVAMDIVAMDYIEAARLRGDSKVRLVVHEILPNAVAPLIAEFGLRFGFVFLSIAALSFLGLGIQPPSADWGSMVREMSNMISFGRLTPFYPAAAIGVLIISVNFVVDWQLQRVSGLKD